MSVVGAVDVGSNAIRCVIGELSDKGRLRVIESDRKAVSLGRSVFDGKDRLINPAIISSAVKAFEDFLKTFEKNSVKCYRAVGTSALRDASNQKEFLSAAHDAGIDLEIISGEEEARLIRLAVQHVEDLSTKRAALLDIGGGSAEFTILINGEVRFSTSEKVGTIRLLKMLAEQKISTERFSERVRRVIDVLVVKIDEALKGNSIEILLATGGNVEELGNLRARIIEGKKKTNKIRYKELCEIINDLEPLSPEERQAKYGFRSDRADVILPASIILREVMQRTGVDKVVIPRVGLREGVLLDLLGAAS